MYSPRQQPEEASACALLEVGDEASNESLNTTPKCRTVTIGALFLACICVTGFLARATSISEGGAFAWRPDGVIGLVEENCTWGRANCNASKCCAAPGMQCYEQHAWYSQCRESCTPGPDPTHWDGQTWSCKKVGERSKGQPEQCSGPGEDCTETKCCKEVGAKCFEKVAGWAACKQECIPDGPDLTDNDERYWSCQALGPQTLGPAPWVKDQCAAAGDDCRKKQCCQTPGFQCYEQSDFWAQCKETCTPGKDPQRDWEPSWSCKERGTRTPGSSAPPADRVAPWVKEKCSWDQTDCKGPRCCLGFNKQCFQKDKNWAMCKEICTAGPHADDGNATWSCLPLGPRSKGLTTKGSPSLFCWALFQTTTYEMGVLQNQLKKNIGIFLCDEQLFLSTDEPTDLGTVDGQVVKSLQVKKATITQSVDGTAGNAKLFIHCWNVVVKDGRWNNYAWIVKVDPDAVLVPDRLRQHLVSHEFETMYFLNCNAYPSSPDFPMMYGALEVISWKAMDTYARNMWICMRDQAGFIPLWGEDRFMKKCLDLLGVASVPDFAIVGDGVCTGVDCASATAAFHPFKSVELWQECWDKAER